MEKAKEHLEYELNYYKNKLKKINNMLKVNTDDWIDCQENIIDCQNALDLLSQSMEKEDD